MNKFWSPLVSELQPYVPGEQPKLADLIKLNTNENPYPPSPRVQAALRAENLDALRLYPDPNADALKRALADYHSLSPAQFFIGNGSDEVLAHIFNGLLQHDAPLLFPDISYSFYPVYCQLYRITYRTIAVSDDFAIDIDAYRQPNGGIIFPNPNAPTGRLLDLAQIEKLLQANTESVVVIDEAYIDFGGDSAMPLIARYPNLLVVQTFSKSRSLAGSRVGFAAGHPELIEALERIKNCFNSYPVDRLAQVAAIAALEDRAYFASTCARIEHSRSWLTRELQTLGFEVLPSQANFVFARHAHRNAADIARLLREQSIIVRHFALPRIDNHLRITVGTGAECETLVRALAKGLAAPA